MTAFDHWFPAQQVIFGRDITADLHEPLARLRIERPFVVCSARARADGCFRSFAERLPAGATIWDGVRPHAPLQSALDAADVARAHRADGIVSFGGGSASDLAKGIALALAEGTGLDAFALRREPGAPPARRSTSPKLPIVACPTTLSGAEVTPGFSLTRADAYKLIFRDAALAARLVVLDPALIEAAPNDMLVGSGMNALAHCCEALYSKARTPISSLFAVEGLRRLSRGLAHRLDGADAADDLLIGAYFAAAAIVNARTALHHAICHKLAPMAATSHGEANTVVLPYALAFNLEQCPAEALQMAEAMGVDENAQTQAEIVTSITGRLRTLAQRAGLPTRLRQFCLERSQLDELSRRVFAEPGLAFNPRRIEHPSEILDVLQRAW